jgi:hypothetical protein
MHPEDENLQSVCALLLRKGRISGQALTAAASVMLVAGAATAAMVGDTSLVSPAPTQATMAIPSAQLSPEPDPIDEPLATLAELSTPKKLEPTAERVVSDAQPEAQPQPTTTRTTRSNSGYDPEVYPAMVDGRCTTEPGALVGYWYAGEQLPGSVGETIMVDRSVHVRRDFPRYGNQFDTRTPTQCFLVEGDEITLREAPIPVPPDSWWVPLHSGDLLRD